MAIVKACFVKNRVKNTGKECDTSMVAPAMLIAVKRGLTFTDADLANPVPWLDNLIHNRTAFPLFGQQAPIREVQNDAEGDVTVTLDDGLKVFLRYGLYNRTFATTSGGLCYAQALQSLNKSGYDIIEIDQTGQMLVRKNADGTYSGLITDFMYAPSPILGDFKNTPYKNRFQFSYSPIELVNNGAIFTGADALLSMMGLINVDIYTSSLSTPPTTTSVSFSVRTECSQDDLTVLFPTKINNPLNYKIVNASTGAIVAASAGIVVGTEVRLTGTFTSGSTYNIYATAPSVWKANLIEGYDANTDLVFATVLIP